MGDCPDPEPSSSELSGFATYNPAATPRRLAPSGRLPIDPVLALGPDPEAGDDEGPACACVDTDSRGVGGISTPFPLACAFRELDILSIWDPSRGLRRLRVDRAVNDE